MFMDASEESDDSQKETQWCGMDMDRLCMAPGAQQKPMIMEDGVVAHHPVANVPYRRTNSGHEELKQDILNSLHPPPPKSTKSVGSNNDDNKSHKSTKSNKSSKSQGSKGNNNDDTAVNNMEEGNANNTQEEEDQQKLDTAEDGKNLKEESTVATESDGSVDQNKNGGGGSSGVIQANVVTISGCADHQTSADVSNVSSFTLPNPNGKAGGACTSALLKVLYGPGGGKAKTGLSFIDVLKRMRTILKNGRYTQLPQLTSSKPLSNSKMFSLLPAGGGGGVNRAVLIGINYTGQNGELKGCQNDCKNMMDYIEKVCGVSPENMIVLMDDGIHAEPTKANILGAYQQVASLSESGDAVFCHYSGHGGRVRDDDYGEEEDGYDETLVPVDYASAGQIRDDDLYKTLVCAMPKGSTLVALMDCCHSATVLDLPYKYRADGTGTGFEATPNSQLSEAGMPGTYLCAGMFCCAIVFCAVFFPIIYA